MKLWMTLKMLSKSLYDGRFTLFLCLGRRYVALGMEEIND